MVTNINRWNYALHFQPETIKGFWKERIKKKRDILLILGSGWDPRMTVFVRILKELGGAGKRDIHLINYRPSITFKSPYQEYIDTNNKTLDLLTKSWALKETVDITTRNAESLYIGDKEIARHYKQLDLSEYTEILVDLSSLPKSLYFTLLYVIVSKAINHHRDLNVHAIVCQNSELDSRIAESVDDTRFLTGFRGQFGRIGKETIPKIWVPILAKNHSKSLERLRDVASPRDVYPILPFPSRNPREDDDLLIEYSQIFADKWSFNLMNFIYAAEDDPIDVYQSLLKLFNQQEEALEPLGGVSMVISALSSKLSSLGAFMAAFEKRKQMAITHAIGRHDPPENMSKEYWDDKYMENFRDNLHSIWLTGEPYEL